MTICHVLPKQNVCLRRSLGGGARRTGAGEEQRAKEPKKKREVCLESFAGEKTARKITCIRFL